MTPIDKLAELFAHFPGIGERQAKRFVYFLLLQNKDYLDNLTDAISTIKSKIGQCQSCFRYFEANGKVLCNECSDPKRDSSLLLVVEKDADLESIKRSGTYTGKFFVLGGLVPIVDKATPTRVRINQLIERITKDKSILSEIILAFSLSPQGDHTDSYVREYISPLIEDTSVRLSTLGRGLSTGTELEYSDKSTIENALKNRQ